MPAKPKDVRRAQAYVPAPIYDQLQKRADANSNSVSNELVRIISKAVQEEVQQQEQTKATA
jgi:hypothetical protein